MSAQQGKQELLRLLDQALKENTRKTLNLEIHIADLSKNTLIRANRLDFSTANAANSQFTQSYIKFIEIVGATARDIKSFQNPNNLDSVELACSIVTDKSIKAANIWIADLKLLVSSSFEAMSTFRTKVYNSPELINDIYFGKVNRTRSLYQILEEKGIALEPGATIDEDALKILLKTSSVSETDLYLFPKTTGSKEISLHKISKFTDKYDKRKIKAVLIPVNTTLSFNQVAVVSNDGNISIYPATKYIGYKVAVDEDTNSISLTTDNIPIIDSRLLSASDIGHAYFINQKTGRTPASEKLRIPKQILDAFSNSQTTRVQQELNKLRKILNKAHGAADFAFYKSDLIKDNSFINAIKNGTTTASGKSVIAVTFQDFKINSKLSSIENRVIASFKKLIAKEILKISGSNTLKQDIVEMAVLGMYEAISGKKSSKKLNPTSNIIGKKDIGFNTTISQKNKSLQKFSEPSANLTLINTNIKKYTNKSVSNLTALQNLLNASLVEQVKRNMGNGTRRDVLNLRTGRFAESVEVTKLSESRQGMITAFYTYMKNPYATFSAGGRQEYPRSRDPKLLIAKSIREIAAQQVGNRLRSVLV